MSEVLKKRIRQNTNFDSPVNEAILNLLVASDALKRQSELICSEIGITTTQYNVLRILRGAGENGHPRYEISQRMIEYSPDVTRLIDRLEKNGLVSRDRSNNDKRHSVTRITEKGLQILDEIQPKFDEVRDQLAEKLSLGEWIALSNICEKLYQDSF